MAGARHALPSCRSSVRRAANVLCGTAAAVGLAITVLPTSALGYADTPTDRAAVVGAGEAVVRGLLFPGGTVTGTLTVTNSSPYDAQVTGVLFATPVVDAQHADCDADSVVLRTVTALPVLPGGESTSARTIAFAATMDRAVGNGCQGAAFTSSYRVTARPV